MGSVGKNQHVTPHPDGGWQVKGQGNSRATLRTTTQKEAIDRARSISQNQGSELVIHRPNGQIRDKDSHGRDPGSRSRHAGPCRTGSRGRRERRAHPHSHHRSGRIRGLICP